MSVRFVLRKPSPKPMAASPSPQSESSKSRNFHAPGISEGSETPLKYFQLDPPLIRVESSPPAVPTEDLQFPPISLARLGLINSIE